ncbi:hypothetical protein [Thermomonas sp.]|uniref:hypothetical protein n=1 Tax=Thermomonas sp. TaxID=1971895 RepID=UPI00391AD3AE
MRLAAAGFILIIAATEVCATEPLMDCNDQVVKYDDSHFVPLESRFSVKPLLQRPDRVLRESDPEFTPESPHRTRAFNRVVIADTMKPGPYSNTIDVFSTKGDAVSWRIEIVGLRDNARLKWINEDLLFIQTWWGRIVSTDMLFEVSTGRFVYAKQANYGLLVQPCEEHNPSVKGTGLRPAHYVER